MLQHVLDVISTQLAVHPAGNLQQQAAAAGAIQAIAYCPTMGPAFARTVAANGAIHPLVDMLTRGPVAMRCAAAGALCNLSLGCPDNQVPSRVLHILRCQSWYLGTLSAVLLRGLCATCLSAAQTTSECGVGLEPFGVHSRTGAAWPGMLTSMIQSACSGLGLGCCTAAGIAEGTGCACRQVQLGMQEGSCGRVRAHPVWVI